MKSKSLAPLPATLALSAFLVTPGFAAETAPAPVAAPATTPAVDTNSEVYKQAYEKAYADAKAKQEADAAAAKNAAAPVAKDKENKLAETTVSAKKEKEAPSYHAESASFKRPTPLAETPQQITIVSQQQLRDRNVADLRQAVQASPGITSNVGEGGFNGGDNFNIRGFSARSDIFIDGIRDTSLYSRDMFSTEQVEISRGANSMYQGRGSTGGSIGLVTKAPHQGSSGDLAVSLSTAESVRAVLDVNYDISANTDSALLKDAGAAARVTVLGQDGGSLRNADIDDNRIGVMPSIAFGLGKQSKITVSHMYLQQDRDADYGIPLQATSDRVVYSPVDYGNWYGIKGFDRDNTTTNLTTVTAETELDTGHRLRNTTRFNTNQRDTLINRPTGANFAAGTVGLSPSGRYTDDATITNQTDYLGQFKTGDIGHTLNVGVELQQEKISNRARTISGGTIPADLWNPNNNALNTRTVVFSGARTKATAETYSAYVNETLHATKWLDLVGGLRVDRFEFTSKSYPAVTGPATTVQSSDTMFSWRGGLVLKPTEELNFYGTVSNTFSPSAQDLGASAANANTDPEETYLYEIGSKWEVIKGKLMLGAAYFYTDRANIRQTDPLTNTQVLTGAAYSQGLELSASGNITKKWNVSGGLAFIDTEVTENPSNTALEGKSLTNTPDFSATIFTTYEIGMGWTIGGGARYTGKRWVDQANTTNYGEYVVLDALLRKQLTDYASIQVNVDNLLDEKYIENARNSQTQWGTPGAGRVISVTARLTF